MSKNCYQFKGVIRMNYKKYRLIIKILCLILVVTALFYLYLSREQLIGDRGEVTVFIIDSGFNKHDGHGKLVKELIVREAGAVEIINLDIGAADGSLQKDLYSGALERILNYSKLNQRKSILVNISLAFKNGEFRKDLIKELSENAVLIIAAAGNNNSERPIFPAGFEAVVAVAAAGTKGKDRKSVV